MWSKWSKQHIILVTDFSVLPQSFHVTNCCCLPWTQGKTLTFPASELERDGWGSPLCLVEKHIVVCFDSAKPNLTNCWLFKWFILSFSLLLSHSLLRLLIFFLSLFFSASLCGEKIQTEKVPKYQLFPAKLSYVCSPSYGDSAPPCLTTTLLTELLGK